MDILTLVPDEGRARLRKAKGSCLDTLYPWISEWGNPILIDEPQGGTLGELKYLISQGKEIKYEIPLVVTSETGSV